MPEAEPGPFRASRTTVYDLFRTRAMHAPQAPAIEAGPTRWSYGELIEGVERVAALIARHGIVRGDRIAVLSENRPEYPRLHLAAAKLGAIVACQNWRLAPPELQHCLDLVTPKIVFVSDRFAPALAKVDVRGAIVLRIEEAPPGGNAGPPGDVDPEDPLLLLYTSGTTGSPKGALISHRAEIARMALVRMDLGIREGDVTVAWAPMFHMGGTDHALSALMSGLPLVVIDGFDVDAILDALARHRLGWLLLVPGAIEQMLDAVERDGVAVRGARAVGCMADLVPGALIARTTTLLKAPFLNSFGATETGVGPLSGDLIPVGIVPASLSKQVNSLCDFRLLDPQGREVGPGEIGEGALRGPTLFSGYWNAPDTNREDFSTGFFRMGDLFRRTPEGRYDFVDRAKYMIKSGGENIYPAEIERVLLADARVADAVVVRKKDARWGEVPVAFVARRTPDLAAADIEELCRRALAGYKRPKEVHFVEFDDLPRSTSGKILRQEMEKRL